MLEALARLGSDVALMQLDAIARKNRIATVRQSAAEKLAQAAAERGLSGDELEDRIAPDLGLDERGGLLLDFGPRQFHVGFDEALVPFVRESVEGQPGARLATAPRPRASDDAERAAAAAERFKALKQDAATVAAQQPLRLERAMRTGRGWPVEDFRRFIAGHPLMRHLAERLVWGVTEGGRDARGLTLLRAAFRVSAEGEWVDADETPLDFDGSDAARIVVAHPLQLSAAQITAFAQQFADYELIQPFEQLHRAVHAPREDERALTALTRWSGRCGRWSRAAGCAGAAAAVPTTMPGRGWAAAARSRCASAPASTTRAPARTRRSTCCITVTRSANSIPSSSARRCATSTRWARAEARYTVPLSLCYVCAGTPRAPFQIRHRSRPWPPPASRQTPHPPVPLPCSARPPRSSTPRRSRSCRRRARTRARRAGP